MQSTTTKWPDLATVTVETSRLGSAALSATYYAGLGLALSPALAGLLGAISFAIDYAKGRAFAIGCTKGGGFVRRLAAFVMFAVLFVSSVLAIDGLLFGLRAKLSTAPADVIQRFDTAAADLKAATAELEGLAPVRTTEAIRAAMDEAPVDRTVFRRTKECTDITKDESLRACGPLLALRKEMAQAIRKRELEARRDELQAKLDALGPRPTAADPQASVFAELTGHSEAVVAWALIAVWGIAAELVACFGPYVMSRTQAPAPSDHSGDVTKMVPDRPTTLQATDADLEAARLAITSEAQAGPSGDRPSGRDGGNGGLPRGPRTPEPPAPDTPKGRVLAHVLTELAMGRSIPRQADLVELHGVPRSTVSDWMREWEEADLIPARRTVGRCKMLAPAG